MSNAIPYQCGSALHDVTKEMLPTNTPSAMRLIEAALLIHSAIAQHKYRQQQRRDRRKPFYGPH